MQIVKHTANLAVSRLVHYSCSASLCAETRLKHRNCSLFVQWEEHWPGAQAGAWGQGWLGAEALAASCPWEAPSKICTNLYFQP